jgi:hypothetical protein
MQPHDILFGTLADPTRRATFDGTRQMTGFLAGRFDHLEDLVKRMDQ